MSSAGRLLLQGVEEGELKERKEAKRMHLFSTYLIALTCCIQKDEKSFSCKKKIWILKRKQSDEAMKREIQEKIRIQLDSVMFEYPRSVSARKPDCLCSLI